MPLLQYHQMDLFSAYKQGTPEPSWYVRRTKWPGAFRRPEYVDVFTRHDFTKVNVEAVSKCKYAPCFKLEAISFA